MEIKTKFDVEDTLVFLTTNDAILNGSSGNPNKPFVCEGIVDSIGFEFKHGKPTTVYNVMVRELGRDGYKWVEVDEKWCAPDATQLGLDVTHRFRFHGVKEPLTKKKRR